MSVKLLTMMVGQVTRGAKVVSVITASFIPLYCREGQEGRWWPADGDVGLRKRLQATEACSCTWQS
jgi:hypothetical protein